jgi:hypothetical protein
MRVLWDSSAAAAFAALRRRRITLPHFLQEKRSVFAAGTFSSAIEYRVAHFGQENFTVYLPSGV